MLLQGKSGGEKGKRVKKRTESEREWQEITSLVLDYELFYDKINVCAQRDAHHCCV